MMPIIDRLCIDFVWISHHNQEFGVITAPPSLQKAQSDKCLVATNGDNWVCALHSCVSVCVCVSTVCAHSHVQNQIQTHENVLKPNPAPRDNKAACSSLRLSLSSPVDIL